MFDVQKVIVEKLKDSSPILAVHDARVAGTHAITAGLLMHNTTDKVKIRTWPLADKFQMVQFMNVGDKVIWAQ